MIKVFSYEEMSEAAGERGMSLESLKEMQRFGYARYDSFETFDCISIEILDYQNLFLSRGSVLFCLDKSGLCCFTLKKREVEEIIRELEGKYSDDKVLYAFFERIMEGDYEAFDSIEKETMELEQALITDGKRDCVSEIISLRKRLMVLKKYYEQLLNVLDILIENEFFDQRTIDAFRMLYRRTERRFQSVLNLRESVTQVRESYEAEVDISLNTTMKIFTVVTTIFMPLTLIAGWYGMNFDIPEYEWKYGYLFVTILSVLIVLAGVLFFRKKKWF